jgi:glutaredoxin-related protein
LSATLQQVQHIIWSKYSLCSEFDCLACDGACLVASVGGLSIFCLLCAARSAQPVDRHVYHPAKKRVLQLLMTLLIALLLVLLLLLLLLLLQGTPEAPRCGFSRKVTEALASDGVSFGSFDILSDECVRQGLKQYSQWPTYPQVGICCISTAGFEISCSTCQDA